MTDRDIRDVAVSLACISYTLVIMGGVILVALLKINATLERFIESISSKDNKEQESCDGPTELQQYRRG